MKVESRETQQIGAKSKQDKRKLGRVDVKTTERRDTEKRIWKPTNKRKETKTQRAKKKPVAQ